MQQRVFTAIVLFFACFLTTRSEAYPQFIGYGYTSCLTCHYNPFGNSPLTDYGRALGATTFSAKPFFNWNATDEQLAEKSDFFAGMLKHPDWVRFAANYRGLAVVDQIQANTATRWINMRMDGSVILRFLENNLIAVGNMGYIPASGTQQGNLISREHYVGYRPMRTLGIYAGKMDVVFGIRIPDHIAYSRVKTGISQNDQTHGIVLHYAGKHIEGGVNGIIGNLQQSSSLRQSGASATVEYDVLEKARLGASALYTKGDFRKRWMTAAHFRLGVGEGSSLMSELGFINESYTGLESKIGAYLFFQNMIRMTRGFHLLLTGESYTERAFDANTRLLRVGPGLQFFPMQRLELRADFQATRIWGQSQVEKDSLRFLWQMSVWL